ncbi:Heavy-metal-associated domain protein [uncultured archaeon]|nr:Heavy-metal-associated domain protein [uncultured archaeon]
MHCASCSQIIEMNLADLVKSAKVSHVRGIAEIEFDEKKVSEKKIKEIIEKGGYKIL